MSAEAEKRAAAEAAAALIEGGMTVGLGTGSTAALFVEALAARRLPIRGVATSKATAAQAAGLGITLIDLDAGGLIDLTVDGADEIGPDLALIKGAGGALLREKLVWSASRSCVVIADASKPVPALGAVPLPVEVVAFGQAATAGRIGSALARLGIDAAPRLRAPGGRVFITDSGNVIYDLACRRIDDPAALGAALKAITGVVDHGLFLGLAEAALVGTATGVERIERRG
ncbi:MAG TPA: ribose-5-phosphate isomerase RpiA [Caulobacteraceae bacterium]|nr:ribose-5-phosphate isomerase RpiA [Caulobacteraceae bacterium]